MTEYWVSQGNKWCDFCKIYIANNPLSIRTHELGQRHKDNVTRRLASMKKESAAKEKEQKEAARALEQIEEKAKRSYQKDLAGFRESKESDEGSSGLKEIPIKYIGESKDWEYDAASGYYYDLANGYYYDSKTGLYYSNALGRWIKQEEAFPSSQASRYPQNQSSNAKNNSTAGSKSPGLVISTPPNPMRNVKGAPSSIASSKRKREDEKPKVISKEEADAIKAREAARKRVEQREKHLLVFTNHIDPEKRHSTVYPFQDMAYGISQKNILVIKEEPKWMYVLLSPSLIGGEKVIGKKRFSWYRSYGARER